MSRSKYSDLADFINCVRNAFADYPDYEITTNLEDPNLQINSKIEYICACNNTVERLIGDLKKGCTTCNKELKQTRKREEKEDSLGFNGPTPTEKFWRKDITEYVDPNLNETWRQYPKSDTFVSDKGRIVNIRGNSFIKINSHKINLVLDGRRGGLSMITIICNLFDVKDKEKLKEKNYVGTLIDPSKGYIPNNIRVISKKDLCKQTVEELKSKQTGYITDEQLPDSLRNLKKVVLDFLPDHYIFENGVVYNRKNCIGGNRPLIGSTDRNLSERRTIRLFTQEGIEKSYYIDLLVLMAFKPIESTYDDFSKTRVIYKNNKVDDCHYTNLDFEEKITVVEQRAIKGEKANIERLTLLRGRIKEAMKIRKAKLITDIDTITTGSQMFDYQCACDTVINICFNEIKGKEGCLICEAKFLEDNTPSKEVHTIEVDGIEQEFRRCDCGWVSANGTFLNNKFQKIASKKDQICLGKVTRNARHQLAKAFKISNYERLGDRGWVVAFKDPDAENTLDNIEVITQSDLAIKTMNNNNTLTPSQLKANSLGLTQEPDSEDDDKVATFLDLNIENVEMKEHPDFPNYKFYSNGLIQYEKKVPTRGRLRRDGYLDINIRGIKHKVHRLICFLFNPRQDIKNFVNYELLQVDHINCKKYDNSASNLRWVTAAENIQHGVVMNSFKNNKALVTYELVNGKKGNLIKRYPTQKECAKDINISVSTITKILRGQIIQRKVFIEHSLS